VQYFDEWEDFRLAELESLLKVLQVPHDKVTFGGYNGSKVFSFIEVPDLDVAKKLCERSILIKAIYEVWGTGASLEEAVEATRAVYSGGGSSNKIDESLFDAKNSWCVNIDVLYKKTSSKIKEDYRNHFKFLDFQGPVRLDEPDVHVQVVVDCRIEYVFSYTIVVPFFSCL
jgi:tRNA (guanine10-N2)-methyltransferase